MGCQLTCAACSVNDSLIFTITFSFASSLAAMSMLATHWSLREHINRLATIIRRSSVARFPATHPSFRLEMLHTLGAQGTSSAVHDDTLRSHVSAPASCEQWLKTRPRLSGRERRDGRGGRDGRTDEAEKEAFLRLRNRLEIEMLRSITIGNTISTIIGDQKHTFTYFFCVFNLRFYSSVPPNLGG